MSRIPASQPPASPRGRSSAAIALAFGGLAVALLAGCPSPSRGGSSAPRPYSHRVEANMDGDEAFESRPSSSGQGSSHSISGEID